MNPTEGILSAATLSKPAKHTGIGSDNLLSVVESLLSPVAIVATLWLAALRYEGEIPPAYLLLGVLVFTLTYPGVARLQSGNRSLLLDVALNWLWVVLLLALTGYATGYIKEFSYKALVLWAWAAPLVETAGCMALRRMAPFILELQGPNQRALIVGINEQGVALADRIQRAPYSRIELVGFVDSRTGNRLHHGPNATDHTDTAQRLLGPLADLAAIAKAQHIQMIYLSLPMASQPRILQILDELKDTTASIYFVPDMFVTDLVQGHPSKVCGLPVISVCETPFRGANGVAKRASDILFSALILLLISPVLLGIAIAVRSTSPGPIIFKQRRYGQNGEEILVYKFRSMTVTEDGGTIQQAQKNDSRITPLGAFLRKTSLDELPQFINVLQGRMSIVGPRPHAVAHNELYRKLIKGYMVRHKVKPGITGWAQVNGFRGETDTLDKMQSRIDYDLDYLRNWSLRLDIHIILKTVRLVLKDQSAY
jgi:putative colanic acid biosynthesis UDP-glucose lipid carrier transferase